MSNYARTLPLFLSAALTMFAGSNAAVADYLAAEAALQTNNYAQAVPLFQEEAELGNPVAAYNLGKIYATGALGAPDYVSAAAWFRQAAEVGSRPARFDGRQLGPQAADLIFAAQLYSQFELAKLYEEGKGVPADVTEAVRWYTRAADQDFDLAQLQLVRIYRQGYGAELPADPAQATKWLTRLAERGNIAAMNELGRAYLQGQGVTKNAKLAYDWFDKASSLGSATAAFNLGLLFQAGYLGQPDYLRAAEKFTLGADRKDAQSMAALGDLYYAGNGVPQSNLQAHIWYDLAARYGLLIAGERRDNVAQAMSQGEVATARSMADQWRPRGDFGLALPATGEPAMPQPATAEPASADPALAPALPEPVVGEPAMTDPAVLQPVTPALAPAVETPQPASDATFIDPIGPAQAPAATVVDPMAAPLDPLVDPLAAPATGTEAPAPQPTAPEDPLLGTPQPGSQPFDPAATN